MTKDALTISRQVLSLLSVPLFEDQDTMPYALKNL